MLQTVTVQMWIYDESLPPGLFPWTPRNSDPGCPHPPHPPHTHFNCPSDASGVDHFWQILNHYIHAYSWPFFNICIFLVVDHVVAWHFLRCWCSEIVCYFGSRHFCRWRCFWLPAVVMQIISGARMSGCCFKGAKTERNGLWLRIGLKMLSMWTVAIQLNMRHYQPLATCSVMSIIYRHVCKTDCAI